MSQLHTYLFVTRHKDNQHIVDHKSRTMCFVGTSDEKANKKFKYFVREGPVGEMARLYKSVNARDNAKVNKALIHFLLDNPDFPVEKLPEKTCGVAQQTNNRAESKWLFDFDSSDETRLKQFVSKIKHIDASVEVSVTPTVSGYAVIVSHGFDTRDLLSNFNDIVELKRDDMLLIDHATNLN